MPHILFVCTANVCRSRLAEGLAESALSGVNVTVSSAGTHSHSGDVMCTVGARVLDGLNIAHADTAAQLTREGIEAADLILGAELAHRGFATRLSPKSAQKIFTLTEAVALGAAISSGSGALRDGPPDFSKWVRNLDSARGTVSAPSAKSCGRWLRRPIDSGWDIIDGHSRSAREHARTIAAVTEATSRLASYLGTLA